MEIVEDNLDGVTTAVTSKSQNVDAPLQRFIEIKNQMLKVLADNCAPPSAVLAWENR
jgi:hypothetical protein